MKDIDSLLRSFWYAIKGFLWMVFNERNFRIHLVCLGYMMFFLFRYDFFVLSKVEYAVLVVCAALVIGGEMINSGIEKADDSVSRETVHTIKISKDVAAGAVLVFAVASVFVGVILLWQPEAFRQLFAHYVQVPSRIALLCISLVVSLLFIFKVNNKFIRKMKKEITKGKK
jgi:diacylglycerol kinase